MKKNLKKKLLTLIGATVMATSTSVVAFADETTPTSMLDSSTLQIVKDFGADIVPTVLALIAIIIPIGLTLWGIGFAMNKGIRFLQRKASQAVKG